MIAWGWPGGGKGLAWWGGRPRKGEECGIDIAGIALVPSFLHIALRMIDFVVV